MAAAAIGTAISVTGWEHLSIEHHARLAESVTVYSAATSSYLAKLQAGGLSADQAYAVLERTITSQGLMLATNEFFLYCAVSFFALIGLVWMTKPSATPAQ